MIKEETETREDISVQDDEFRCLTDLQLAFVGGGIGDVIVG